MFHNTYDISVCAFYVWCNRGRITLKNGIRLEAVLLAMTVAQNKFLGAMVRSPGSNSDSGMFNMHQLPQAIERKTEDFPESDSSPHHGLNMPYFLAMTTCVLFTHT
ncbi:hypothetical protein DPMN_111600 [Dreissena polymorpha]|uniref:Uncharacterized protein n=1 Tax=Dreissena polymorpha TaxID=45954 RepID=A0A9D4KE58_DREPO|nr:hypothetical protein DPMN_111600 [Dreissena polymorpha]